MYPSGFQVEFLFQRKEQFRYGEVVSILWGHEVAARGVTCDVIRRSVTDIVSLSREADKKANNMQPSELFRGREAEPKSARV